MKGIFSLKELRELWKGDKRIAAALLIGAALILLLSFGGSRGTESAARPAEDRSAYEAELEKRLTDILSEVEGIGELSVMVTLDTSERTEYGKNEDMLLGVKMPEVRGVIVVCDGGGNVVVREKVIRAVSGVFGISSTRVSVIQ
ncbi:MAG: hypothetical protein NC084_05255 [Bacteroides sp.]|nr:hypothetical protein [Eubacterium sp.]MCM1418830.1 hypothetical protein [Roseburia sp.]MCM1462104.1 hypothetical protein [Bacteroides sp.]